MKKILVRALVFLYPVLNFANDSRFSRVVLPPVICYGSDSNSFTRVMPSDSFLLKSTNNNPGLTFITTFKNMSSSAQNAFNYATGQWGQYLKSPVPVNVLIESKNLGSGVLGSAATTGFYYNFEGAIENQLYPVALMEKILRTDINNNYDISISVSNDATIWYYGIDGNTPAGKYDFVSVMMHELAHGLGFIGSMKINSQGLGEWGYDFYDGFPALFDVHVQNNFGQFLVNESVFANPSTALKQQYTSNNLYFYSQLSLIKSPEYNLARLYAPSAFNAGSSIYHLNDASYPAGNINSLMTHATGTAEAIHVPGPLTQNIMEEMGWNYTYIDHVPHKDVEDTIAPIYLGAFISSDYPPVFPKNYIFYKNRDSLNFDSIPIFVEENGEYINSITVNQSGQFIEYYIKSVDNFGISFTKPVKAPGSLYTFYVGADTIKPVLDYNPVPFMIVGKDSVEIVARANDNMGIDSVIVFYKINSGDTNSFVLVNDTLDIYSGHFVFQEQTLKVNDLVEFWFMVTDISRLKNTTLFIDDNMYFEVKEIAVTKETYFQDFDTITTDFTQISKDEKSTDDIKFQISTPDGFDNPCLHTPNPYRSPGQNNSSFDYITQLYYPILLKENAALRFDEIVLVEPSESGESFGSDRFWDYVIVQVSKDSGVTWFNLQPGYDARKSFTWLSAYTSNYDNNNNSTTVATPSMYITNRIDILDNPLLKVGDEVMFRFRLYSDPYAHGWGWAIDNLSIQAPLTIHPLPFDNSVINIYPNPVEEILTVQVQFEKPVESFRISINDIYGRNLKYLESITGDQAIDQEINMRDLPSGIYILVLDAESEKRIKKIIKR